MKVRRRFVEVAKSTHCHIGRSQVAEHVEQAVKAASDDSKVEVSRRGGCVTIRTLEQREVLEAAPAPFASSIMTLESPKEPKGD